MGVVPDSGLVLSLGRSLVSGLVWSMLVVVVLVLGKDLSGVGLVHDQNVVECLPADRAHHALAVGVHPRRLRRAEQYLHLLHFEDGVEGAGVLAVAVAKGEAQGLDAGAEIRGEVAGLLGRPLCGGVGGDTGDVESAGTVLEEHQRVQAPAGHGVHVEEDRSDDPLRLQGEELSPARTGATRGRDDAASVQDLPHS